MRIISGKFKGRQLVEFDAAHIRPTTDRVKETLFNKLMGYVEGARVLDLFSGTGNLAIECLSRGAVHVDMVESHKQSLKIIRENLDKLKIAEGFKLHAIDAFRYIAGYSGAPYDIVIADPPFTQTLAHDLAGKIGASTLLGPESVFVIESSSNERLDENYPGLNRLDQRVFGDKHLTFFAKVNYGQGDLSR
jgi:16S rRNA (guanine966-N2)-methyltransferase